MWGRASRRYGQAWSTKSLLQRLAALENGAVLPGNPESDRIIAEQLSAKSRKRILRTYFGLGFVSSAIVGCAALLFLLFMPSG